MKSNLFQRIMVIIQLLVIASLIYGCNTSPRVEFITTKDNMRFQKTWQTAKSITQVNDSCYMLDFGNDAFSQIELILDGKKGDTAILHLGECIRDSLVDRNPGGSRRYRTIKLPLENGRNTYTPKIAKDLGNTRHPAVLMPEQIGEVTPFRYLEIHSKSKIGKHDISRIMVNVPFDDNASYFKSDNESLNRVWELCKYSIKATTYTGYYVDGDRERICYEADALINQLGHYATDASYDVARRTLERLLEFPTWPTEWSLQLVLVAWNDYLYTGSKELIEKHYDDLKVHSLFALRDSTTCLITSLRGQTPDFLESISRKEPIRDIVDWPHSGTLGLATGQGGEDDGYVYTDFNTVVNAYHYYAAKYLSKIAKALGKNEEAQELEEYCNDFYTIFNNAFLDKTTGIYRDGIGTDHSSLHANMFPLAFGLVPDESKDNVTDFVISRGMSCSVYGSQFLLDALYEGARADIALNYMTSEQKRGWLNMLREGSTITMEAWGNEFKPNQDWNHAWGAAPANIIPMRILGVRPLLPAFEVVEIRPQIASLEFVEGLVPSPKGGIYVKIGKSDMNIKLPEGVSSIIYIPKNMVAVNNATSENDNKADKYDKTDFSEITVNGTSCHIEIEGEFLKIAGLLTGDNIICY